MNHPPLGILAIFYVLLVLYPSHLPCERSAVAFLLTNPDPEMS